MRSGKRWRVKQKTHHPPHELLLRDIEEFVDPFPMLEVLDERVDGHARAGEDGRAAENVRIQ